VEFDVLEDSGSSIIPTKGNLLQGICLLSYMFTAVVLFYNLNRGSCSGLINYGICGSVLSCDKSIIKLCMLCEDLCWQIKLYSTHLQLVVDIKAHDGQHISFLFF
jgi:hypothetical protein